MQVTLNQEQNLAIVKFSDVETVADLLKASDVLVDTEGYQTTMNVLYDLSALEITSKTPVRYGQVEGLATMVKQRDLKKSTKVALLVRNELSYGIMSMYVRSVSTQFELDRKIFLNLDDAHKWLASK